MLVALLGWTDALTLLTVPTEIVNVVLGTYMPDGSIVCGVGSGWGVGVGVGSGWGVGVGSGWGVGVGSGWGVGVLQSLTVYSLVASVLLPALSLTVYFNVWVPALDVSIPSILTLFVISLSTSS